MLQVYHAEIDMKIVVAPWKALALRFADHFCLRWESSDLHTERRHTLT